MLNGKKENKIILKCLGVQRFQMNLKIYPRLKKKMMELGSLKSFFASQIPKLLRASVNQGKFLINIHQIYI